MKLHHTLGKQQRTSTKGTHSEEKKNERKEQKCGRGKPALIIADARDQSSDDNLTSHFVEQSQIKQKSYIQQSRSSAMCVRVRVWYVRVHVRVFVRGRTSILRAEEQ